MTNGNGGEIGFTGPGVSGYAKGDRLIYMVIFMAFLAIFGYVNWKDHTQIVQELQVQSYLLSLPVEERPRLVPPHVIQERKQR